MRVLWSTLSGFLLLFFLSTAPSTARIKTIKIQSDNRPMILFDKFSFTMDVQTYMFNHDGARNNYLSPGLTQLLSLYFIFSLLYLCFIGFWIHVCFRNRRAVHRLHLLMGVLLIMKTLSLFTAAVDKHFVKVTGASHGWNVLYYIFEFMNSVLSVTVIMLIGSGWPYLKPLLLEKEKKVLMIVIPLQALANVAYIVIGETSLFIEDSVIWNPVFSLAEFILFFPVVLPVVWLIWSFLRFDAKGARNNVKEFKVLCVAVISYLLFTRIGVFALKIFVAYTLCVAAEEIAQIVFYLVVFYMLRPVGDFVLDYGGGYEEAAELVKG